jgi:hypothetical protein
MNALAILALCVALAGCEAEGNFALRRTEITPAPVAPIETVIEGLSEAQQVRSLERQLAR